jgi:hypothetical protein
VLNILGYCSVPLLVRTLPVTPMEESSTTIVLNSEADKMTTNRGLVIKPNLEFTNLSTVLIASSAEDFMPKTDKHNIKSNSNHPVIRKNFRNTEPILPPEETVKTQIQNLLDEIEDLQLQILKLEEETKEQAKLIDISKLVVSQAEKEYSAVQAQISTIRNFKDESPELSTLLSMVSSFIFKLERVNKKRGRPITSNDNGC